MLKQRWGRTSSVSKAVAGGTLTSLITGFLGAAVLARVLDAEMMKMENMGYGVMIIHLVSVFLGARISVNGAGEKAATAAAALSGGIYYLCLLAVNGAFFGGAYEGMGMTLLLVILAAAAAVVISVKDPRKKGRRRYKIPK